MPNWCRTDIYFRGSKEEITDFRNKLMEYTSKEFTKTDFGKEWLGNILYGVGLEDRIYDTKNEIDCRGTLQEVNDITHSDDGDKYQFNITTFTAWMPMVALFYKTIKKLGYKTIYLAAQAEEMGNEVFILHDPYGMGVFDDFQVYVDIYIGDEDRGKFAGLDEIECGEHYWSKRQLRHFLDEFGYQDVDELNNLPFEDEESYLMVHYFTDENDSSALR